MAAKEALDFPDFLRAENSNKRRVLAKPLALVRFSAKRFADGVQGQREKLLPLDITSEQRRRIGVLSGPSLKIAYSNFKQRR